MDLFLNQRQLKLLCNVGNTGSYKKDLSIASLAKKTDWMTYSHALGLIKEMESRGLVHTEINGRVRQVTLTSKGLGLKELLIKANQLLL